MGRNRSNKYRRQLLNTLKVASKKVADKAAETTAAFIGNKITSKAVKPKPVPEKMIISREQREETLNELRQIL